MWKRTYLTRHISTFINVLLDIGDELVLASDANGTFDFGNESRVRRIVYHLLKRVDPNQRLPLLQHAFNQGRGIGVQCYLLVALIEEANKQAAGGEESLMAAAGLDDLKAIWVSKVRAVGEPLLTNSQLPRLLHAWQEWGGATEVRSWCTQSTASDEGLLTFLPHFCSHTTSQTWGDRAVRIKSRLNPTRIEKYIDTGAAAARLIALEQTGNVPESAKEAVSQFLIEFEMIKAGKNPEAMDAFDD